MSRQHPIEFPALAALPHARLASLRMIRATGADVTDFLHAQLTHDVAGLAPGHARLAAYCNAKGRTQASLLVWPCHTSSEPPAYGLLVAADLAEALVKRLRMFVLRAKVELELTDHEVTGIWPGQTPAPEGWPSSGQVSDLANDAGWLIGAASAEPRGWCVARPGHAFATESLPEDAWWLEEIRMGIPWIRKATFELFTPLAVNFDLIDGVSFTKGCYPGQEVVARSHYRGKQKRRTLRASAAGAVASVTELPGTDVFSVGAREPVGRVVNAAQHDATLEILFEAPHATIDPASLRLGSVDGPELQLQPLPYSLAGEPG